MNQSRVMPPPRAAAVAAALLAGADPQSHHGRDPGAVPKVTKVKGSGVVVDWLLDDLDPAATGDQLTESERVMATRLDENRFLVRMENFPSAHQGEASALLPRTAHRDPP